ncbi:hypothetical protein ACFWSF_09870 [Streptomyces sp. NPDC058611]|uniref:hypothetical protein n=1 Tax=unclassified Streptomyces TaxID=2593676 RepID=UPI00364CA9A2
MASPIGTSPLTTGPSSSASALHRLSRLAVASTSDRGAAPSPSQASPGGKARAAASNTAGSRSAERVASAVCTNSVTAKTPLSAGKTAHPAKDPPVTAQGRRGPSDVPSGRRYQRQK